MASKGKKRWRKHVASDVKSFRRVRGSKPPAKGILIVTEGEVTEPIYFHALQAKLALATVEIEIVGEGIGDPRRLAEAAIEHRKARRRAAKKNKVGFMKAPDFDEVWIVFDTDVIKPGKFADGVAFAEANGVKLAHSTPCFEFWLLLHLLYTTAPMPKCVDVIPRIEAETGESYAKTPETTRELVKALIGCYKKAHQHAGRIREHHTAAGTPPPANPSTEVDRLIESLDESVAPANESKGCPPRNLEEESSPEKDASPDSDAEE